MCQFIPLNTMRMTTWLLVVVPIKEKKRDAEKTHDATQGRRKDLSWFLFSLAPGVPSF
jgi:hypothetical protein